MDHKHMRIDPNSEVDRMSTNKSHCWWYYTCVPFNKKDWVRNWIKPRQLQVPLFHDNNAVIHTTKIVSLYKFTLYDIMPRHE